jgi:hypothetical protein
LTEQKKLQAGACTKAWRKTQQGSHRNLEDQPLRAAFNRRLRACLEIPSMRAAWA